MMLEVLNSTIYLIIKYFYLICSMKNIMNTKKTKDYIKRNNELSNQSSSKAIELGKSI